MKKSLITIILLLLTFTSFAQKKPKIKGNRIVTEINKEILETFSTIEISDELEVTLHLDEKNEYRLKTDENLIDIIQFNVKDEILKIYSTNRIVRSKKLEIDLYVNDIKNLILKNNSKVTSDEKLKLKNIHISGYDSSRLDLDITADDMTIVLSDKVKGQIKVKSDSFSIEMNDKADLKGYIATDKIKVSLTKSTKLKLEGDAKNAILNIKGSSELIAKKMKIETIDLNTHNKADVNVYVRKKLELDARDKSIVYIYGNPKLDVKNLTEASKIIKK